MIPKSNLHTHTTFCDGKLSPDLMTKAAIEKGMASLGFSGHAHMPRGGDRWCMSVEDTEAYRAAIGSLKEIYADQIEIALGVEQDYLSDMPTDCYEYVIGAVHCIDKGEILPVDSSAELFDRGVNEIYLGDVYAFIRDYYEMMSNVVAKTNADIIAHFDLVKKFNEGGVRFDESCAVYRDLSLSALEAVAKNDVIFEINTGGAYRGANSEFYPSPTLLKRLKELGGRITFSSDSHDARSLCYKFDEAKAIAKKCGFKTAWIWRGGGFKEYKI